MDDVIKLLTETYTKDGEGNLIPTQQAREVFCDVRSISRAEFYQAAQSDLHPEYIFRISHYMDYQNEKVVRYKDWRGETLDLSVIRTYRDGDAIELSCQERVGNEEFGSSVSGHS